MADVTAKSAVQKEGEARVDAFRQDLGPFVVAAEKTRMPMVFTNEEPGHPIIFANDAFLALTGYEREEVLAKSFQSLLAAGVDAETMPIVEAAFRGECESDPDIHYKRKDGREFWASMFVSPVCKEDGTVVQQFVSLVDMTETKRAERQLVQAQKMEAVGQIAGGIAHDFNNLLMVVGGNAELLADFDLPPEAESMVALITRAADRGAELTNRLLSFARKQVLEPKTISIATHLDSVGELLRRVIPENISVETRCEDNSWLAEADPGQLENALLNLALNARDAMPDGGLLTIEASNIELDKDYVRVDNGLKEGQYVQISVTDSGYGMSPETLAQAFDPFFTTKPIGEGTGLGLSMVYGFAKQSGGHLSIYSEMGLGTTARLYLPRVNGAAEPVKTTRSERNLPQGHETILLVEDQAEVLAFVHKVMELLGYTVIAASNGPEALDVLNSEQAIDLLFTDIVMPGGMSGIDLAKAAVKLRPDLKVLLTSGYAGNTIVHDGRLDRDVKLLSKPYGRERLANILRELLD